MITKFTLRPWYWIILAVIIGAAFGAAIVSLIYALDLLETLGVSHMATYGFKKISGVFHIGFIFWLIGLVIGGVPIWVILHERRCREWPYALFVGFTLCFVLSLFATTKFSLIRTGAEPHFTAVENGRATFLNNGITPYGWWLGITESLWFGAQGAAVGFLIWIIAYREIKKAE